MTIINNSKPRNHYALVLDASGSMSHIVEKVKALVDLQVQTLKETTDQENYLSLFTFGESKHPTREVYYQRGVKDLGPLTDYRAEGGTPLRDGVMRALNRLDDGFTDISKVVIVLTDGDENASTRFSNEELTMKINKLQATDLYTIVFLVPDRHGVDAAKRFGVPEGNIRIWTNVEKAAAEIREGTQMVAEARRRGETKVTDFFQPDLSKVKAKDLKKMRKITGEARIIKVTKEVVIKEFVESKNKGSFKPGTVFYQLMKTEKKVQDYKNVLVLDKKSKELYANGRQLLGLPEHGDVKMEPGNHANFEIFIQSNSNNRKLPRGTSIVIWDPALVPA